MGLAQRKIESAGVATVVLSNIPELTRSVSVPRLVGIEYPFGQVAGSPNDRETQRAILLETLKAAEEMHVPGSERHLPFRWAGSENKAWTKSSEPPPIAKYLKRHPWYLSKLFSRDIPGN